MNNLQIPKNLESEKAILGAILVDNKLITDVIEVLKPSDFYLDSHKHIYKAIYELYKQDKAIDTITLTTQLKSTLDVCGGISYIAKLASSGMCYNVKEYCNIIKEYSRKRTIINNATEMLKMASDEEFKSSDIISQFESKMLLENESDGTMLTSSELAIKTLEFIENNYNNGGDIIGMKSGLKTLDNWVDGFQKKNLYVLAGRPSMGKTLLALNLSLGLSKNNKGALFEMEMDAESLGIRMLASKTNINGVKMRRGKIEEDEFERVLGASNSLSQNNLFVDTSSSQTIYDIKSKAKKLKLQHNIDFIVIDHIGLLGESRKGISRNDHIAEITWQCKVIAKELDINVIILSQLNRGVEMRQDKRPVLSDLRESGSVEQDADVVMFVYRDEYYNPETQDKNIMEILIPKQRNGKVGAIKVYCNLQSQLIGDLMN